MKVLITGAAGFIGFHLALALRQQDVEVLGLDHFNDYYDLNLKRSRQRYLKERGTLIFEEDLCNTPFLCQLLKEQKITHLVHLAAQAGVRYSLSHPQAYVHSNLDGFVSVLEACRSFPSVHLTYASSSSVYGKNKKIPFHEDDPTDQPVNLYGATKKSNELLAFAYHHLYHFPTIGLRFFTVYGPWGRPDMAYFSFTKAILENRPISLFNNGKMKRDFTYIDDIIRGILAAMHKISGYELFNLGGHHPIGLEELITTLETALGKKARIEKTPMQEGEVLETYADITKSQEMLGYIPQVSFSEGILQFVSWYQGFYK